MKFLPSRRPGLYAVVAGIVLGVGVSTPAWSQWKWRDNSGRITVSDTPPPPGVAEKDVLKRPGDTIRLRPAAVEAAASAPASAAVGASPRVDAELEARRKRAEQEQATQRKQEEERVAHERAENCKRAQAQLRSLDSGMRLARVNDKGEREILDDKQRADETQRTRSVIASDCR